jgi:hypothetical protein
VPASPVVMVHSPVDDLVPYDNAVSAVAAFDAMGVGKLVRVVDVSPVPLLSIALGTHMAAYPSAMAAAFAAIEEIRAAY